MGIELGLVGIGSAILGGLGASATFLAGTFGMVISGAIGGALVGAAVGGLTSAIMGGDIMQGVLFGAVGGAVTGGLSGYFSAGSVLSGGTDLATGITTEAGRAGGMVFDSVSGEVVSNTARATTQATIGGSLQKAGGYLIKEFGGDIVKGVAGNIMKMKEMDMTQANKLEEMKYASDLRIKEAQEQAKLTAQYSSAGGGGGGGGQEVPYMDIERIRQQTEREKLAEQRRQFNLQAGEREQARADLLKKEGDRQALFKGYQRRGATADTDAEDRGVYEDRQEQGLAGVVGSQPLTGNVPAVAVQSPELAQAMEDQALLVETQKREEEGA